MLSTGIAGQVLGTKCALASSNLMCKWLYKLNTKKYVFAPPPAIVLYCGDISSSPKNSNLFTTHLRPCPNISRGLAVKMVIPSQAGLDKSATHLFWALVRQLFCSTSSQKKSVADLSRPACEGITILTASPPAMLGQGRGCVVNKLEFFVLLEMSPQCKEL